MQTQTPPAHKVRSACDSCHKAKMKCSKGTPCAACARSGSRCCYSVSDRLGRPPKSVAKRQKSGVHTNTTSKGREMTTPQLFKGYDCHSEELLTLDDMSVDAFSESLSALSSSEALSCHAFANAEHTGNNLVSLKVSRVQLALLCFSDFRIFFLSLVIVGTSCSRHSSIGRPATTAVGFKSVVPLALRA